MSTSAKPEKSMLARTLFFCLALSALIPVSATAQTTAPESAAAPDKSVSPAPPARPITQAELQDWMEQSMQLDANRAHIQEGMDQMRKTLPPWVPDSVWADVKKNVANIDLVALALPVYQRYFSQQDGLALVLMYQGPTGQEYARLTLQSRLDALHQGLQGSQAEASAMKTDKAANVEALRRKRVAELTPDELRQVRSLADDSHIMGDVWRHLDDEQDVLLKAKINEVFQATMKAHNAELVAAQRAYAAKQGH